MFFQTNVQCPYCKHNNKISVEVTDKRNISGVHYCDTCEKDFALYSTLSITSFVKRITENEPEEVKA